MSGLALISGGAAFACAAGFYLRGRNVRSPRAVLGGVLAVLAVLLAAGLVLTLLPAPSAAAETTAASAASGLGFLGASLATGLACLGAGIAVAAPGVDCLQLGGCGSGEIGLQPAVDHRPAGDAAKPRTVGVTRSIGHMPS